MENKIHEIRPYQARPSRVQPIDLNPIHTYPVWMTNASLDRVTPWAMTPIMASFSRAKNVAEIRVKPENKFHRNIQEIQAGADHLRFNQTGGMEMDQQRNVLGTADEEFHHRKIMRL